MKIHAVFLALLFTFGACERHSVTELTVLEKEGHESGAAAAGTPAAAPGESPGAAPKFFPPSK